MPIATDKVGEQYLTKQKAALQEFRPATGNSQQATDEKRRKLHASK